MHPVANKYVQNVITDTELTEHRTAPCNFDLFHWLRSIVATWGNFLCEIKKLQLILSSVVDLTFAIVSSQYNLMQTSIYQSLD